jgi:signal transduction histidine kinase/CheY-like chemotaxis protein
MIIGYLLILKLQKLISAPLLSFKEVVDSIRETSNFNLRVKQESTDEIGQLVQGFNAMLVEVKVREANLVNNRKILERKVYERTQGIEEVNQALKRALDEVTTERDKAELANKAKSEFLAMMSHEIRTPMNGILGMTELLSGTALSPQQQNYAKTAHESGEILLKLINDILDYSKIEAGKMQIDETEFDISEMLSRTCSLFSGQLSDKNLRFTLRVDRRINDLLVADLGKLRQILINFIGNAIKFTEQGGIEVKFEILNQDLVQTEFKLSVKDTGIGIKEDKRKAIFEPFSQADGSTTREYGGSGLGLTISKRMIEMMGGEIGVNSIYNEGSEFWIKASLQKGRAIDGKVENIEEVLATRSILVIHDTDHDPLIRKNLDLPGVVNVGISEHRRHEDRLKLIEEQVAGLDKELCLVIIDTSSVIERNINFANEIRRLSNNLLLPVIFVSGDAGFKNNDEFLSGNDFYLLPKPVKEEDYQLVLEQTLTQRRFLEPDASEASKENDVLDLKILLVEDNLVNQKVATAMIKKTGCEVVVAENGREAVDLYKQGSFQAILMDCQMPVLDGYQATQEIRKFEEEENVSRIPVIALTANAVSGDREKALEAGMDDYLSKPYCFEQLYAVIKKSTNDPLNFEF